MAGTDGFEPSSSLSESGVLATELRANNNWGTVRESNPGSAFRRRAIDPSHGAWSTRLDSNQHPQPSESCAHPIELRVETGGDDQNRTDIYSVQTSRPPIERHPHFRTGARRRNRTDVAGFAIQSSEPAGDQQVDANLGLPAEARDRQSGPTFAKGYGGQPSPD